jgi:hypothetical protein
MKRESEKRGEDNFVKCMSVSGGWMWVFEFVVSIVPVVVIHLLTVSFFVTHCVF